MSQQVSATSGNEISDAMRDAIEELRSNGFAVVIFGPDELDGVDPGQVEGWLVSLGTAMVDNLKGLT